MKRLRSLLLLIPALLAAGSLLAQRDALTARQIVQRSIDSSGGDAVFDTLRATELVHEIRTPEGNLLSFVTKRKGNDRFLISTLSLGHVNSTQIYNRGKAVLIVNDSVSPVTDPVLLEDMQLQCYPSIDYAYKKLGYTLTRQDDVRFQNFDCYVVLARSPGGEGTLNFYDKANGRLLMRVYSNGHKAIFTHYAQAGGFYSPSQILMPGNDTAITRSQLRRLLLTPDLDDNWFTLPPPGPYAAPADFRRGTYRYLGREAGQSFARSGNRQTERGRDGGETAYLINWQGPNDYLRVRLKDPEKPATDSNIEYSKVRVIGWSGARYYCQYLTLDNYGGTFVVERAP